MYNAIIDGYYYTILVPEGTQRITLTYEQDIQASTI